MKMEYTHDLNREVLSISGRYELDKEERIEIDGREILYVVGNAVVDSSCCGYGGCRYAIVPGYVLRWKWRTDEKGLPVSEVEPVLNDDLREKIRKIIQDKEWVGQVQFW
ncbi:MAG: hypothetical protein QXH17_07630 [Candidatus Bathyarchaeia archaeon]